MNIIILGAGGVGCYFGARLLRADHKVTFVARSEHLAALQNDGLVIDHPDFSFSQPVRAMSLDDLLSTVDPSSVDVVLIALKSMVTIEAAAQCAQWIKSADQSPFFVSLQNGVDNETHLAKSLGIEK
jgi:2-dehydropantoate 2-reductase